MSHPGAPLFFLLGPFLLGTANLAHTVTASMAVKLGSWPKCLGAAWGASISPPPILRLVHELRENSVQVFFYFFKFERDRENTSGGGVKERENPKQALYCQHRAQHGA